MKLSLFGRFALALFASTILGLGMTGCGGGTIAFLWVLGQQYNQIAGFKVDDYTGNLTQIPHEPFTSNGSNPVMLVVKPGGRYVFVLNQGTGGAQGVHATNGNVSVFSVGGDGVLTFQQSYVTQGYNSQWLQTDQTGGFLFVLDQYSPSGDGNGAITSFAVDPDTGRLTLIQNTQSCGNAQCPTYFEVGSSATSGAFPAPFQMKQSGSCLYVANRTQIVPFQILSGQLGVVSNGAVVPVPGGAQNISSITGNNSYINITDSATDILTRFSVSAGCNLAGTPQGQINLATYGVGDPNYTLIDNSGKYLYVLSGVNSNTIPGQRYSSITGFTIVPTTNQLQFISTYGVGSNPVCMLEDPTNQYIYTSNHNDGTLSGNVINTTTGDLSPLTRGSTFAATGDSECLAVSGSID